MLPPQFCVAEHSPVSGNPFPASASHTAVYDPTTRLEILDRLEIFIFGKIMLFQFTSNLRPGPHLTRVNLITVSTTTLMKVALTESMILLESIKYYFIFTSKTQCLI